MSSDLAFWKAGEGQPADLYNDLADGVTDAVEPPSDVSWFRAELLSRWPDLVDVLEPTEYDLLDVPEDGAKYVLLTLPVDMLSYVDDIVKLARGYRLGGYSSVVDQAF